MRTGVLWLALCACGNGDDSGADAASNTPGETGFVQLTSRSFMASGTSYDAGTASGTFITYTGEACTEQVVGECRLYTCPTSFPPSTYHSAGTLTVTGATQPISLTPMADKTYETYRAGALFAGGETLGVSATGADIAPFAGSVTAPSLITITAPAPVNDALTIDRAQPFHATWTGASAGRVILSFSGPTGATLSCSYDASTGSADVPASALAMVPAGQGRFDASSFNVTAVESGDWRVNVQASFDAVWTDLAVVSNIDSIYE